MNKKVFSLVFLLTVGSLSLTSCEKENGNDSTISSTTDGGGSSSSSSTSTGPEAPDNDGTLLSSITSSGQSFNGKVVVSGVRTNDFYIEDQSGAGFVYNKSNHSYKPGDRLQLSGTTSEFGGNIQISQPNISLIDEGFGLKPASNITLSQLGSHKFERVSLTNLKVVSTQPGAGASDAFITVSDGSASNIKIFAKKTMLSEEKSKVDTLISSLKPNDNLVINGAFADSYSNSPQIALTSADQIEVNAASLTVDEKLARVEAELATKFNNITVRRDISLPTSGDYSAQIAWDSLNKSVLSNTGKVTRPAEGKPDATVNLKVTITIEGKTLTKTYKVTVKAQSSTEGDYEGNYVEPNYTGNYYDSVNPDLRDNQMLMALYSYLAKTNMPSQFSYSYNWTVFAKSDADPNNPGRMFGYYSTKSYTKGEMNREHTWPNSRGGNYCEKDPHMVRPTWTQDNSGRGNDFYNKASDGKYDPGFMDPSYRGDAARIIFYCAVKYQNNGLKLVDLTNDSTGNKSMGKLSTLLEWNLMYDITDKEIQRNEVIYKEFNWVRNPFIDDRNYACKIWGNTNSETRRVCGLK